jgi:hypothetical protein
MRPTSLSLFVAVSAIFCAAHPASARFSGTPDWAMQAASRATPPNVGSAPVVVLLDETRNDVDAQGVATRTHRLAVRLLTVPGKEYARVDLYYLKGTDRVTTTDGWLIRGGKEIKAPEYSDWVDLSSDPYGALYSDFRSEALSRSSDAVVGDVFIAETQVVGPMLTSDTGYDWSWGGIPVVEQIYRLKIPGGFSVSPSLHGENAPTYTKSADGREHTWTQLNQPFVMTEPFTPGHNPMQPTLLVKIDPPAGATKYTSKVLQSWNDVATWIQTLNAGQCDTSPQLAEASKRLTANCATPIAKIRALGAYVQSLRYVALYEGVARGLGYQARKASQVFGNGYGDCKDKANLLRAMLREVGVESYVAAARSGDDRAIWSEFAAASQFDHAITAIRVDENVTLPAVAKSGKYGALLFFDPTDEHTRVGDLPWHLQGTSVFVQADGNDSLITLPQIALPEGHKSIRKAVMRLNADGSCTGTASISGLGQAGAELRRGLFLASTDEDLSKFAVTQLGDSTRGAQLLKVVRQESADSDACGLSFEFAKPNYLQFLKNSLAVVKTDVLTRGAIPAFPASERHMPVKLRPVAFDDELQLVLSEGLASEELPAAVNLTSAYGTYSRDFKLDGKSITLVRRFELKSQTVPIAEYTALKKFLSDVGKAERASVLLRTKA